MRIAAALQQHDLGANSTGCGREQHISPAEALHAAVRFYIEREGDRPTIDYRDDPDRA